MVGLGIPLLSEREYSNYIAMILLIYIRTTVRLYIDSLSDSFQINLCKIMYTNVINAFSITDR